MRLYVSTLNLEQNFFPPFEMYVQEDMLFEKKNPFNQYRKFASLHNLFSNNYHEFGNTCSISTHHFACGWRMSHAVKLSDQVPTSSKQNWESKHLAYVSEN